MSLNLISSLSLLKSRLEKTQEQGSASVRTKTKHAAGPAKPVSRFSAKMDVRRLNSTDMFAGITESDLDTSSSSDDDDDDDDDSSISSRVSSPSGFNTPETGTANEPTQVSQVKSSHSTCCIQFIISSCLHTIFTVSHKQNIKSTNCRIFSRSAWRC